MKAIHGRIAVSLLAFTLATPGCASLPIPAYQWEIVVPREDGGLRLLRFSSDEAFAGQHRVEATEIQHLRSHAFYGYLHPGTRLLATVETRSSTDTSRVVRIYGENMTLLCEHPSAPESTTRDRPSPPVISPRGDSVAFVTCDGWLTVAALQGGTIMARPVYEFKEVKDRMHGCMCVWLDEDHVVVCLDLWIYLVDVQTSECERLARGQLAGVIGRKIAVAHSVYQVEFLDEHGRVLGLEPPSLCARPWETSKAYWYPGVRLRRLSPDGSFLAFDSQTFWTGTQGVFLRHLKSGQETILTKKELGGRCEIGSWHEVPSG